MELPSFLRRHGDLLAAGALAVTMTLEVAAWAGADATLSVAVGLLATLPLAVRRRSALVSFVLVMTGLHLLLALEPGFDNDSMAFVVAFFWALYSLGRHARGLDRWIGAGCLVVVMLLFAHGEGGVGTMDPGDAAFLLAFVGAPWAAGLTIQLRRDREAIMRADYLRLEAEQEERARRAVAEERARIARELHDVVSHAIAVTVLQARGARRTLGVDEEQVRRALDAIERTNTAALSDMRRLLAVLRDTEQDRGTVGGAGEEHGPQPSLAHLGGLVDHVRASGLPVEVVSVGAGPDLPPGVDLSAYRIIQEALTNVIKHAGSSSAVVQLDYGPDELRINVTDDGAGAPGGDPPGGHGLIGIRERVAVVGGDVEAGPRAGGGFEVSVRLPYALEVS